jgi:hypothetical protein
MPNNQAAEQDVLGPVASMVHAQAEVDEAGHAALDCDAPRVGS